MKHRSAPREIPFSVAAVDTLPLIAMLTLADRHILDFERGWWMYPFPKECTIADVLGFEPDRYYARLRQLVDLPEADRYDPLTVRRLRALIGSP